MKNKLYNIIFPIWILIFIPPIILFVIPANFIIDLIALIIILKILKIDNIKQILKTNYLKVVGFGFLADIIGAIFLFISVYIKPIENISWDPYQNIISIIYLFIMFLLSTYLIYLFNSKFNFKIEQTKKISILLAILTAPYLFLVPTKILYNQDLTIYNYDETSITSTSKINKILDYLETEYEYTKRNIDSKNKTIEISIKDSDTYYNYYKDLEEQSALLFALTTDLNKVIFNINDNQYIFEYNYINKIFKNVRDININNIYERYSKDYFNDYIYLGNINGKYDLVDMSEKCESNLQEIYEDDLFKYLVSCSEVEKLIVINNDKEIALKEALKNNLLTINQLSNTTLKVFKEAK